MSRINAIVSGQWQLEILSRELYLRRVIQKEVIILTLWTLALGNYKNTKGHGSKYPGDSSSKTLVWHIEEPGTGKQVDWASWERRSSEFSFLSLPYQNAPECSVHSKYSINVGGSDRTHTPSVTDSDAVDNGRLESFLFDQHSKCLSFKYANFQGLCLLVT